MDDVEVRLTEWQDGWHWTVFDADPDYQSDRVEGVLVPWAVAEVREPSSAKALRKALIAAVHEPCGKATVTVPLAVAASWALMCDHDHVNRAALGDTPPNPNLDSESANPSSARAGEVGG